MELTIKRAEKHLRALNEHLLGSISQNKGLFKLDIGQQVGSGSVTCICFNKCMTAYEYDITLKEDMHIPLNAPDMDILYFAYCLEGSSSVRLQESGNFVRLDNLQTAVVYNNQETEGVLKVEKGQRFVFNLIGIDKKRYESHFKDNFHGLEGKLRHLLEQFGNGKKFLHMGAYNLKIGEQIKMLQEQQFDNEIASFLRFEGICNLILANQISQFYLDVNQRSNTTSLTSQELQLIHQVSEFIVNYPEVQHAIKSLCKKSGLSPNKLQEGFKFMHGRTVSDYVRNVRVEKAEELLRTTDMNISEVVYSVGLTSRSYFCKIFKNKYNCSPKQYKSKRLNKVNLSEVSA
ncbi:MULTISPECIES: helix-turn-helix domain-containing protein [Robiginitalea]|uniref:Transcriptional regulatory protein n=1 Tax=Robiginitalea biformata (strain ATCC BAA-864 / DSM 15991 / KCTC 12146 / HTCC2501) TaxID=313596 RepID=A4CJ21_ROBBH|nr:MULTISPECIES: AraC family transcriptional regulator [Robiginitalea]EAR16929.1 transcriptional regulatory protein [Robiginitalea biformata HTCC2501]MDC6352867.1 AraC family transcriptional regulator [Robiginitalea sp. PM2]MDC6373966.1 AraC family transcriptional regulator [Robiginitalea sp. SP8]